MGSSSIASSQQNGVTTRPARYADDKGNAPGYIDVKDIHVAYLAMQQEYVKSGAFAELRNIVDPMVDKIDRIVVCGLGAPHNGKKETFQQIAMVNGARHLLQGPDRKNPKTIKVFHCEPANHGLDADFLDGLLCWDEVLYDSEATNKDNLPAEYSSFIAGKIRTCKSWCEVTDIGIAKEVTRSTLLIMPYLPFPVTLRILAETSPAMVITNSLENMWNNRVLVQPDRGFVTKESEKHFGEGWTKQYEAWEWLTDMCIRRALTRMNHPRTDGSGLWAYEPTETAYYGWEKGMEGLVLDIRDAVYSFVEDYEG